jgi:hypothetical protein
MVIIGAGKGEKSCIYTGITINDVKDLITFCLLGLFFSCGANTAEQRGKAQISPGTFAGPPIFHSTFTISVHLASVLVVLVDSEAISVFIASPLSLGTRW